MRNSGVSGSAMGSVDVVSSSNSTHSSGSGLSSVGKRLAKALSSELKAIKKNFLALFGFGRLSPTPVEIGRNVLELTDEQKAEFVAHSELARAGGETVAGELKQLIAQMKELDKQAPKHEQDNYRERVSNLLVEIQERAQEKTSHLKGETAPPLPTVDSLLTYDISEEVEEVEEVEEIEEQPTLPEDVQKETSALTELSTKIQALLENNEKVFPEAETIIARYAQTPEKRTIERARKMSDAPDLSLLGLSLDWNLMVHYLKQNPAYMESLSFLNKATLGWRGTVHQQERASDEYGVGIQYLLGDQKAPRISVANKMVGLLTAAAEGKVDLAKHFTPDEVRYLNQSIGLAEKPPALWHKVEILEIPEKPGSSENNRKGFYLGNPFIPHQQLANQMAALLKPNHQQSILARLEQVRSHLAAPSPNKEAAWVTFNQIDDRAAQYFFGAKKDKALLSNVLGHLKQTMASLPSSSSPSGLLRAISEKLSNLEKGLAIDQGTEHSEAATSSEIHEISVSSPPRSSSGLQLEELAQGGDDQVLDNRKAWFFHDFDVTGLNAAFFEESFRDEVMFSPERLESFLDRLEHAKNEIAAIRLPEKQPDAERQKLVSMLSGLNDHLQAQKGAMEAFNQQQVEVSGSMDSPQHVPIKHIDESHFVKLNGINNQLQRLLKNVERK